MKFAASLLSISVFFLSSVAQAAEWTPAAWADEETLEFLTDCPDEGEHWSYVWLVVLDGDVYLRLGSKAGARVDCSRTKPFTSIKVAGQQFDKVEMVDSPEMVERVATAMGDKYWSDIFIGFVPHPYTMKLVPQAVEAAAAPAASSGELKPE